MFLFERKRLRNGDMFRIILSHEAWRNPWSTGRITYAADFDLNLLEAASRFIEYKEVPSEEIRIEVQSFRIPRGSRRLRGQLRATKKSLGRKKSLITIRNCDSLCAARAVVTAVANLNKEKWTESEIHNGFDKSRRLQRDEAWKLHEMSGVKISEDGSALEDLQKFAKTLGVQIKVFDSGKFNELIFETELKERTVCLLKNGNHFDVITFLPGFLGEKYFCSTCNKPYCNRDKHRCPNNCLSCFKWFKDGKVCSMKEENLIVCKDCDREFFGGSCFLEHKRNRSSRKEETVCDLIQKCLKFERNSKDLWKHGCRFSISLNWRKYCDIRRHKCFIRKKPVKGGKCSGCDSESPCFTRRTYSENYVFYDMETQQNTGKHVVNVLDRLPELQGGHMDF